jgi:hypothetical protein
MNIGPMEKSAQRWCGNGIVGLGSFVGRRSSSSDATRISGVLTQASSQENHYKLIIIVTAKLKCHQVRKVEMSL